jgi:tetratricopeptide (TPR) repeat protein
MKCSSIKGKAKGVSVHYLKTTFAKEVRNYRINHGNDSDNDDILQRTTIYDLENTHEEKNGFIRLKGADVTCPRDNRIGAAYVDCIQGEDNVGDANVMISYAWCNTVTEIIDIFDQFTLRKGLNPKRTYVWICCLCNNQHRVFESKKKGESVPFEEFQEMFETQVMSVDSIVSLMSPWREPNYLKRVWCIFEMHTAQHNKCDITIEMPKEEREDFKEAILDIPDIIEEMLETFSNIHIDRANASVQEDKDNILKVVKAGVGVDSLNVTVAEMIRTWFFTQLKEFVNELDVDVEKENYGGKFPSELTTGYRSLGYTFFRNGDYETAMHCFTKQVKLSEKCFGYDNDYTVDSYKGIAIVYDALGQYEEAIQYHEKSMTTDEKMYGEGTW